MPSAPEHLPDAAAAVWGEISATFAASGDDISRVSGPDLDAYVGQVVRLRDAQARVDREGMVVADAKGQPIPHPALALERDAQKEIRAWGDTFRPRRRGR